MLFLDLATFKTLIFSIAVSVALFFLVNNRVIVIVCGKRLSCVCRIFLWCLNFSIMSQAQYELLSMSKVHSGNTPLAFSSRIDNGVRMCIPYENSPDK